jgi:hypothetical protein
MEFRKFSKLPKSFRAFAPRRTLHRKKRGAKVRARCDILKVSGSFDDNGKLFGFFVIDKIEVGPGFQGAEDAFTVGREAV